MRDVESSGKSVTEISGSVDSRLEKAPPALVWGEWCENQESRETDFIVWFDVQLDFFSSQGADSALAISFEGFLGRYQNMTG